MDLSGILTVQDLCVFSCVEPKYIIQNKDSSLPKVFRFLWMENLSPVFANPLFALKQENLVVVAVSYFLRVDSAALASITKPDLPENWTANRELTACRLISLATREMTTLSSKPLRNRNRKRPGTLWGVLTTMNICKFFVPCLIHLINQNLSISGDSKASFWVIAA